MNKLNLRMISKLISLILLLGINIQTYAQWNKVQNSSITFKIKNAGIWVNGSFTSATIQVNINESNPSQSTFSGIVESTSIQTGIKLRDNHLRDKDDFFNVEKFPTLSMKSVSVSIKSPGVYTIKWSLTIKGITKFFFSDVNTQRDGNALKLFASFTINRNDWNLGGKSFTMSDNVTVKLFTTVIK
jgi:polyisoprenoid-binding protein YceI